MSKNKRFYNPPRIIVVEELLEATLLTASLQGKIKRVNYEDDPYDDDPFNNPLIERQSYFTDNNSTYNSFGEQ